MSNSIIIIRKILLTDDINSLSSLLLALHYLPLCLCLISCCVSFRITSAAAFALDEIMPPYCFMTVLYASESRDLDSSHFRLTSSLRHPKRQSGHIAV